MGPGWVPGWGPPAADVLGGLTRLTATALGPPRPEPPSGRGLGGVPEGGPGVWAGAHIIGSVNIAELAEAAVP